MAIRQYEIISDIDDRTGSVRIRFIDGTDAIVTRHYLPMKEDSSAYSQEELDDFIADIWPSNEFEKKRQAANPTRDPFAVVRTNRNVRVNVDQKLASRGR